MARFRNYKDYEFDNTGNIDDYWTSDSKYNYLNKIDAKGISRIFGDIIKYGKTSKKVLR